QVSDGRNATYTQNFTILASVGGDTTYPVITDQPPQEATVGQLFAFTMTGYDPDGDPVTWKLVSPPTGASIDPNRGTILWTPTADQVGSQLLQIQLEDDHGRGAGLSGYIAVHGVNLPPVISSTPPVQVQAGSAYNYAVAATDPDA